MNVKSAFRRLASGAALLAASLPQVAHAGAALDQLKSGVSSTGTATGLPTKSLPDLIGAFVIQAMTLLGIVLVVLVIYAGFLWMTAQGSEEKIKKAKNIITSAVIGLILIFAAYAITNFVVGALSNANG